MTSKKDELLKRVTGNQVKPQPRPKPASAAKLLPKEEEALRAAGWTPEMGIPSNMADIVASMKTQPGLDADITNQTMAVDDEEAPEDFLTKLSQVEKKSTFSVPDTSKLLGDWDKRSPLQKAMDEAKKKKQEEDILKAFKNQDPVKVAQAVIEDAEAKIQETQDKTPAHEHKFETLSTELSVCVHCGRNQKTPALLTPDIDKRRAYHWAFLGDKPYQDETSMYDGTINITTRTLRTGEYDWVTNQAGLIMKSRYPDASAFPTQDYYEIVTRLRVGLQLVRVAKQTPNGPSVEQFPESVQEWLALLKDIEKEEFNSKAPGITLLKWFNESLCATESVYRVYARVVDAFNAQVDKLEIMWGTPDFLTETV